MTASAVRDLFKCLDERRRMLGMSYAALARRSGVSMPTVIRILSGRHKAASFENILAIAEVLGIEVHLHPCADVDQIREQEAQRKAEWLTRMLQGTLGLEGQGLDADKLKLMRSRTYHELLAGSSRKLWGE